MKYLKKFDKINEEWFPRGPWVKMKNDNGTIFEIWGNRMVFVGGKGDHISQIKEILDTLYSGGNIQDSFILNGVDDTTLTEFVIYKDNVKDGDLSLLDQYGKKTTKYGDLIYKLNKPIIIELPDSEEKTKLRFGKKLNDLYIKLEYSELPNTPEVNAAIDTLLASFEKDEE